MDRNLPDWLEAERVQLMEEMHDLFAGVTRRGGVSWSQARVIDDYGTPEEEREARKLDHDSSWQQLAYDMSWKGWNSEGMWSFLDGVGFRYYLTATMMHSLIVKYDLANIQLGQYREPGECWLTDMWSGFDAQQMRWIAKYVRHMVALEGGQIHGAYRSHWRHIDAASVSEQILEAFPKLPPPALGAEASPELSYFTDRDWTELASTVEQMPWGAFLLLSPSAAAYYLPGLMLAAIEQGAGELSEAIQDLLDPDWSDLAIEVASCLTQDQRTAVWEYIRLMDAWFGPEVFEQHHIDMWEGPWYHLKRPLLRNARDLWRPRPSANS
jgi:hypothetical protein